MALCCCFLQRERLECLKLDPSLKTDYLSRKATGLVQPMCWATVPVLKLPANLPSKWIWLRIVGLLLLNNENDTFSGSFGTPFLSYPPDLQCVMWNLKFPWSANICHHFPHLKAIWVWINTYRYIFSWMNIHLPAILGFTRYQGFDPSPYLR